MMSTPSILQLEVGMLELTLSCNSTQLGDMESALVSKRLEANEAAMDLSSNDRGHLSGGDAVSLMLGNGESLLPQLEEEGVGR